MPVGKPHLSLTRILQMNLGFLGLQFSFGLQQANPIFAYLGADEADFPWLGIAGPLTGLIVQPLIGVMSDRTLSRFGRRTPYFLIGALMCSAGLFLMPFSQSLLMAFSILFLLDVGNNITMEPYRAYVNDRLREEQRGFGFLSQSGFTGLAQCLAYISPFLLVNLFGVSKLAAPGVIPEYTRLAFHIGAVLSLTTILWSIWRVPELPLSADERARIAALPRGFKSTFAEIFAAMREMPQAMRTMGWMSLFQWYAMCCYWAYRVPSISMALFGTSDGSTQQFREADLLSGPMGAFYNGIAFVAAFSMAPLARRFGAVHLHATCLVLTGCAMITMPMLNSEPPMWVMMGIMGLGWGSIMGNPYIILANAIPAERTGVYMGIFNMMICAPMLVFAGTMTFIYEPVLGGDPRNALAFGGVLMLCAAAAVLRIRTDGETGARVPAAA
ncbi:MFS transporter [Novosphingobium sp.]|uniref:MFS transporter n=1 Tax=Novosphingobium sp. TaxID=1874826 RepID=UPI00286D12CB|nr:MFS transporter [Novosphingobium sp.]